MWMVGGYNESSHHNHHHHHQLSLVPHDAFNGRRLRPLIPRPPDASSTPCASSSTTPSCNLSRCTISDLFSLNQHLGVSGEQGSYKKEMNNGAPPPMVSTSRWNPTPEQLRMLEDLYRRGTRTPSTEQIQRITAELRRYGKIEGKNVFYWFQNHKARERQKRRRELELLPHDHQPIIERKERGGVSGRTGFDAEQSRSYHSISSAVVAEEAVVMSMQRAAAKAGRRSEQGRREWLFHLDDEREFQKQQTLSYTSAQRNATWQHLMPFCHATSPPPPPPITSPTATNKQGRGKPEGYDDVEEDQNDDVSATLQLFPLRSQVEREHEEVDEKERDVLFFEFLPTKN